MKILRGTLTFVLGMIIGIILFVVAIGGTLAILATQMTVGDIQRSVAGPDAEIISPDSEVYNKTILDAVKSIVDDVQNFDTLSMKTLYEHYGIKLLNGISGIDFTDKDFYSVPIPELINDMSIVVNSFTLNDVSKIAGVDFASYNLPVLTNNLDNNLKTAMDNILGSLNGDLSIRAINSNFGIDLGIQDNALLATVQDVSLSQFGAVMSALRVSSILEADTDTFIPSDPAARKYFLPTDAYEAISASELGSRDPRLGAETSIIGGKDSDGDGTADTLDTVETRYVRNVKTVDGAEVITYTVDNSSYAAEYDPASDETTYYRHIIYSPATAADSGDLYVLGYANRVESVNGNDYTLITKEYLPVSSLETESELWAMTGDVLDKDSKLAKLEEGETAETTYLRAHVGSSTTLLQSIAHLTIGELQKADNLLDGLTVGDVIDDTPDTAKIIKSLIARNCKLTALGTVANELTLGEMIDITNYSYVACESGRTGKYVRISDPDSYTLYDKNNPDHIGAERYKKNSDGTFTPDANGKFVHSVYYTLYNPAVHTGETLVTYDRKELGEGETVSSALLQRFSGATLGGFSNAFDSLMLSDVMQIDSDVYATADSDYIAANPDERYFYYDSEHSVYCVANAEFMAKPENESTQYYHIVYSGEGTSFIKKLAYVKVDGLAGALDVVINDMMLSEFIEIISDYEVELTPAPHSGSTVAGNKYFVPYDEHGNGYAETVANGDGTETTNYYVYVYDPLGEFALANARPVKATPSTSGSIKYKYKSYGDTDSVLAGLSGEALTARIALAIASGNMFYKEYGEYKRNHALCAYMLMHADHRANVYYRVTSSDADAIEKPIYSGSYYIRDDSLGFIPYDPALANHADRDLYTFENAESGKYFFIDRADADFMQIALADTGYKKSSVYLARRKCQNVYALTSATENVYVFLDGQYVEYNSETHGADAERFEKKLGYVAESTEVSYDNAGTNSSDLIFYDITHVSRQPSTPVLRLLSRGTIGETDTIISNATISDIIDPDPGSFFDEPAIRNAKITDLGNAFTEILSTVTVGKLMTWSKAADVDENVKRALDNMPISSLFSSLVIDGETKEIKVSMLKLYGYDKANENKPAPTE